MPNRPYNIDTYNSTLKSEVTTLTIIAVILSIIFIAIIVYSIIQIKNDKSKKLPYIQLIVAIAVFIFLAISLGSQIISYTNDITEEAYIQYEGPVTVRTEKQIILGGLPTGYTEYVISFEHNGKQIELSMRKDYGLVGDIDNIYIVYSQHSNYILEIEK